MLLSTKIYAKIATPTCSSNEDPWYTSLEGFHEVGEGIMFGGVLWVLIGIIHNQDRRVQRRGLHAITAFG